MPPEIRETMNNLFKNEYYFYISVDDIVNVTMGSKTDHMNTVEETNKVMDDAWITLKSEKCNIAKEETYWLRTSC